MAINGIFGTLFIPNFFEFMQRVEENVLQKPKWNRLKKGFSKDAVDQKNNEQQNV